PPRKQEDPQASAAEAGAAVTPVDGETYGNTAGVMPESWRVPPELTTAEKVGEVLVGGMEGVGFLAYGIARFGALNVLTCGTYGTYELGSALWAGYEEDCGLGALNAVNPLYAIAKGGADTYLAVERGDFRAAGRAGAQTAILGAVTVLG